MSVGKSIDIIANKASPAAVADPAVTAAQLPFNLTGCRPGRANATSRLSGQAHWHRGVSSACVARHQPSPRGFLGILDERHVSRSQLSCGTEVQSPRSSRIFDRVRRTRMCCCADAQRLCGREKTWREYCAAWNGEWIGDFSLVTCRSTAAARWKSGAQSDWSAGEEKAAVGRQKRQGWVLDGAGGRATVPLDPQLSQPGGRAYHAKTVVSGT